MFSNESARQADNCRFCWMCRHICPVAGATGSEGWTPRARGLMVSMIERGTPYDGEIAEAMYHCSMCDACANDCVTGFRPTDFIREARMLAVVGNFAPAAVMKEINNITEKGNIYGLPEDPALTEALASLPTQAETLLYIGQSGRTVAADTALAVYSLLKKAGLSFTALRQEPPTGAFLTDLMGATGDVQAAAARAAEAIRASGARRVLVLSPYDAVMLRDSYSQWGLLPGVEVVTVTAALAALIRDGKLRCTTTGIRASLQEPVKLTRGLEEEQPLLDILAALGVDYIPLFLHGKMARCVGTPLLAGYDPGVVRRMVEVRLDDARRLGSPIILTASPDDGCGRERSVHLAERTLLTKRRRLWQVNSHWEWTLAAVPPKRLC